METVRLTHAGLDREYLVSRPPADGAPLWIFLHGMGCTAAWAVDETRLDAFARAQGLALVAPQALRPKPDEPPKFLTNAPRWNDGFRPDEADDVGFLDAVLADALARTGADPRRVFVTGFSNGAGMTYRYAALRSERLAAIAPIAGHCWIERPEPATPLPTLALVGTRDPLIPLLGGAIELPWGNKLVHRPPVLQSLERWAVANGCSVDSEIERDDDELRVVRFPGPIKFRAVTVVGLGHHWPGGKGQLNPRIGGPTSNVINANEFLADFFKRVSVTEVSG